jgi:adenine-specific DNA methylase
MSIRCPYCGHITPPATGLLTVEVPGVAGYHILASSAAQRAWDWLASDKSLSVEFHGPVYGDDDEPEEWRVYRESGNINDREWDVIGIGATPLAAVLAALQAEGAQG